MQDFIVYDVPAALDRDRSRVERELSERAYRTLFAFLEAQAGLVQLTHGPLVDPASRARVRDQVWWSEFTDDGKAFIRRAETTWFCALDRGADPGDDAPLRRLLERMRRGGELPTLT